MNAGFSNLATLRAWLLPPDTVSTNDGRFDQALLALGLGVAGQIEKHCDRQFAYAVGATAIFTGEKACLVLPRYPLVTLTSIERRDRAAADWTALDLDTVLVELDESAGLVTMAGPGGTGVPPATAFSNAPGIFVGRGDDWTRRVRLRFTWTGGYWWDDTEDNSGSLPDAATALPADLQLAWKLQCEFFWQRKDKLGVPLDAGAGRTRYDLLGTEPFSPQVKDLLSAYRRIQLL